MIMAPKEKLEDILMTVAEKIDDNRYLQAIKNAFTAYMPFIIVGSFGTLFSALISSPKTGLAQWIPALESLSGAFSAINFATMTFMTVPIVFLIAMQLARSNKTPEHLTGIVAALAYISVVPQSLTAVVGEETKKIGAVSATALGAQGLFIGMLMAIIVAELFRILIKIEAIKIKMPPSVPAGIATSFNTLIPILIIVLGMAIFGNVFKTVTGQYLNEFIYAIVQTPLEIALKSPLGILALVIAGQIFWFLGIHGGLVITPLRNPLFVTALAANIAAVEVGKVPHEAFTMSFWMNFIVPGGAGVTLSLLIAIFLFSKREEHRMIAKLGLLPGICSINEPVVFGLPLVLNPTFAIPFIFNSAIGAGIALFATKIGFLVPNVVEVPFGVPIIISPFISHGWQGVVIQLLIFFVCTLCWIPFVLVSNKEAEKKEATVA
jgi:PTS system, lactose/cellobiose family IIC component